MRILFGDDFDGFIVIFRSYRYDANASEAVEKIATDETYYHKCSLYVKKFYNHNISMRE